MSIIICGCVKNCEKYLDSVFENINIISKKYNVLQIVLSFDLSSDKTLIKLIKLKKINNKIHIIINKNPLTNSRTQNISNARNKILNYIRNLTIKPDYFLMMDFDDVCSKKINMNVLNKSFEIKDKWDCISFNNEQYYDYWALSFDEYIFSCWHTNKPREIIKKMHEKFKTKCKNKEYILCDSAFNGFAIYKTNIFIDINYKSIVDFNIFDQTKLKKFKKNNNILINNNSFYDCEHRYFHFQAKKKNNARILLLNKNLFPKYSGEHARFLYN